MYHFVGIIEMGAEDVPPPHIFFRIVFLTTESHYCLHYIIYYMCVYVYKYTYMCVYVLTYTHIYYRSNIYFIPYKHNNSFQKQVLGLDASTMSILPL